MKSFRINPERQLDEFIERCINQCPELIKYASKKALQMLANRLETLETRFSGDICDIDSARKQIVEILSSTIMNQDCSFLGKINDSDLGCLVKGMVSQSDAPKIIRDELDDFAYSLINRRPNEMYLFALDTEEGEIRPRKVKTFGEKYSLRDFWANKRFNISVDNRDEDLEVRFNIHLGEVYQVHINSPKGRRAIQGFLYDIEFYTDRIGEPFLKSAKFNKGILIDRLKNEVEYFKRQSIHATDASNPYRLRFLKRLSQLQRDSFLKRYERAKNVADTHVRGVYEI